MEKNKRRLVVLSGQEVEEVQSILLEKSPHSLYDGEASEGEIEIRVEELSSDSRQVKAVLYLLVKANFNDDDPQNPRWLHFVLDEGPIYVPVEKEGDDKDKNQPREWELYDKLDNTLDHRIISIVMEKAWVSY